jgi:PAS domain S-box-containing protein
MQQVASGKSASRRCENGLHHLAIPIIIDGSVLGSVHIGQFFYSDDQPDLYQIRRNEKRMEASLDAYIHALSTVPVFSKEKVDEILEAYEAFVQLVTSAGEQRLKAVIQNQELLKAKRELAQSEERFRTLFERSPNAYYLVDLNGMVIDGNRAAEAMLGVHREDVIGKSFFEIQLLPPESHVTAINALAQNRQNIPSGPNQYTLVRQDGTRILAEISTYPITFADQTLILGVAHDVTEQKKTEAEKVQLEAVLRQSQKMEAIGRLAGGVAHDFNNLLTGISCNIVLALNDLSPEDPRFELLDEIKDSASRAAALTRQLLAFSRRQVIEPQALDLNEVILELQKLLKRIIGEDISLDTTLTNEICTIQADRNQIEQVILNLAVNARDAMPHGGKLWIETSNESLDETYCHAHSAAHPGPYVRLNITDSGQGMDGETRAQIFEPFFTTKPQNQGTGLGLSMVYGIVQQHGGTIEVYSEIGLGTTFKIYLPAVEQPAEQCPDSEPLLSTCNGGETILLVEDDDVVRDVGAKVLKGLGYRVLDAHGGPEAVLISTRHPGNIDLLLTDVVMPGMNGRTLANELLKTRPSLRVLFTSGYTQNFIVKRGVLDHGVHFLPKPFSPKTIAKKVYEALCAAPHRLSLPPSLLDPSPTSILIKR